MLAFAATALALSCTSLHAADKPDAEEKTGASVAAQILGAAPLHESAEVQRYVNLLGNAVARAIGNPRRWRFAVVQSDAVNAFAAPGGYVLLSSGLLRLLVSEHELAFVLAHEIAHIDHQHHYKVIRRQRLADAALRELNDGERDEDVSRLATTNAQVYARGLDRRAEFEADSRGVEIMLRAGYDPAAAIDVLAKLMALQGNDPRAELLFSTHPSPGERLDQLMAAGIEALPRPAAASQEAERRFSRFRSQL